MAERVRGDPAFAGAGGVQSAARPGQPAQRRQAETRCAKPAGELRRMALRHAADPRFDSAGPVGNSFAGVASRAWTLPAGAGKPGRCC